MGLCLRVPSGAFSWSSAFGSMETFPGQVLLGPLGEGFVGLGTSTFYVQIFGTLPSGSTENFGAIAFQLSMFFFPFLSLTNMVYTCGEGKWYLGYPEG